ncbi:MAG: hypothetical protein KUG77_18550 [Nannocystaceae bacterium]|nr:hypothetical protein [Nannocystaceae bacterium]
MTRTTLHAWLFGLALTMGGCDDSAPQDAGDTDAETDDDGDACDPIGAQPEQAALFNAPLEADVEVIQKVPTHPGPPGPASLP